MEAAWGRRLPPSYRAFLAIHNGIENFEGTHLLLGTEDHLGSWADEQVAQITQFWNEDEESEFDIATVIPLAVPDGDFGIQDFRAFERGDGEELEVIDWDTGDAFERFPSFKHYLASLVGADLEEDDDEDEVDAWANDTNARALFALDDTSEIAAAVEELVAARPTLSDLSAFKHYIDPDIRKGTPQAIARAELLFRIPLGDDKTVRDTWVRAMNNAIAVAYNVIDLEQ